MTFFLLFLDILFCPQNCSLDFLISSLDLSTQNRARNALISIITEIQKSLDFTNQDFFSTRRREIFTRRREISTRRREI